MAALLDAAVTLPDGRQLAYTEWGQPDGKPVLGFHGTPGSRLWCPDEEATAAVGVRLILPDRPGIGRSDPLAGRGYGDWPLDVEALADDLGLDAFGVVGYSAGGPYAAACAALIPGRLTGVAVASSRVLTRDNWAERPEARWEWPEEDRATFDLAVTDRGAAADLAARRFAEEVGSLEDYPSQIHEELMAAPGDRWFFDDTERVARFDAFLRETWRQGLDGFKGELLDSLLPWGFRLAEISIPVHLFHGGQDPWVTQEDLDFQAKMLPESTLVVWPDVGHLGFVKHWAEILSAVL